MARRAAARAALAAAALALAAPNGAAAEARGGPHLLGTVVSSDASRSLAVVEEAGAHRVVRVGADLAGGTVVEIRADGLLLRRGGRLETLDLQSESLTASGGSGPVPASPAALDTGDSPAWDARSGGLARSRPSAGALAQRRPAQRSASPSPPPRASRPSDAASPKSADEIMAELSMQARFVPVMDNDGKLRGVALLNVVPDSVLERLGLRSDDVVTGVNGVPVDSTGKLLPYLHGLDPGKPVKVDLQRGGVPTTVTVDLHHL